MDELDHKRRVICINCIRRAGARGSWICPESGVPYRAQIEQGECPAEKFPARGLGDLLAKLLRRLRVDKPIKAAIARLFGDCGCDKRRAWLNRLSPKTWVRWAGRAVSWVWTAPRGRSPRASSRSAS